MADGFDITMTKRALGWAAAAITAAVLTASGVASASASLKVTEPVGPDPTVAPTSDQNGSLVVYTAREEGTDAEGDDETPPTFPYSAYEILNANGERIAKVRNRGFEEQGPELVALQPGSYLVRGLGLQGKRALAHGPQKVEVPVRIDRGKTTAVHLDSPWQPPQELRGEGMAVLASPSWPLGWSARAGARLGLEGEVRYVGSPVIAGILSRAPLPEGHASLSVDENVADPLGALKLRSADLAGIAGSAARSDGYGCRVIGRDRLAVVVRSDSPLRKLSGADLSALLGGRLTSWSSFGGNGTPIVLAVGQGTGARAVVTSRHAVSVDPDELQRMVTTAGDVIGVTSLGSLHGIRGIRVVALEPDAAARVPGLDVPLSLCAAESSNRAQSILAWATSAEGQGVVARTLGKAGQGAEP